MPFSILYANSYITRLQGTPIASYHDFKVGGNNSINFIRSNTISTTVRPDTTDNVSTTTSIETTSVSYNIDVSCH